MTSFQALHVNRQVLVVVVVVAAAAAAAAAVAIADAVGGGDDCDDDADGSGGQRISLHMQQWRPTFTAEEYDACMDIE